MSEKNPLAGFAEGSSKDASRKINVNPDAMKTIGIPRDADAQKVAEALQKLPTTAATAIYDPKTGEFTQLSGEPLPPEVLAKAKERAVAEAAKQCGAGLSTADLKEAYERIQKGESAEDVVKAMGDKLGITAKDLKTAQKLTQGETMVSPHMILEETHELTRLHGMAKEFVQNSKDKFGVAEGELRIQYYLEGAATALSWAMGLTKISTTEFFREKLDVHPEWACADPECKTCAVLRESYANDPKRSLPPTGVKK